MDKLRPLFDNDLRESITGIVAESSKLKREIFKTIMMGRELDLRVIKLFMGSVNDFLKFWDDYATQLEEAMKTTKGTTGVRTLDYSVVKDWVYAKFDYASVLPFADGLIKGIESKKFEKVDDIEDFRDHTIAKAFDGHAPNVAGLIDDVCGAWDWNTTRVTKTNAVSAKMFDTIRKYNMFDRRSRTELYKAIQKVIEYLTIDLKKRSLPKNNDMKLFVSMINNVVEYISYSMAIFACRIHIIGTYVYPFVGAEADDGGEEKAANVAMSEATETKDKKTKKKDKKENDDEPVEKTEPSSLTPETTGPSSSDYDVEITVLRDADDRIAKDPNSIKEYFDVFSNFIKACGADSTFKDGKKPSYNNSYMPPDSMDNNAFGKKLISNPLHEFLFKNRFQAMPYNANDKQIEELWHVLKSFMYNSTHGVQGSSTPKQEILHVIRGTDLGDSVGKYRELARDLYCCALHFLCNIDRFTKDVSEWANRPENNMQRNITTRNNASDCLRMLSELYRDLAMAFLQKGRDIEMQISRATVKNIDKIMDSLTLKVPNAKQKMELDHANIATAVPDTTRLPTDLMDLYALPAFESLSMWDEYLASLPEFADNAYFNEAFSLMEIIKAILSKITGSWTRVFNFFNDSKTQQAIKWVQNNRDGILNTNVRGVNLKVADYRANLTLPEGFERLRDGLNNIPQNGWDDVGKVQEWIKSLYPNETVYNWFNGNDEQKRNNILKYKNWFLFQDLEKVDEGDHTKALVNIGDTRVAQNVTGWVDTVSKANDLRDQLKKLYDEMTRSVNKLRDMANKAANAAKQESTSTVSEWMQYLEDGDTSGQGGGDGGQGSTEPPKTEPAKPEGQPPANGAPPAGDPSKQPQSMQQPTDLLQTALTGASNAVNNLYNPHGVWILEYIMDQYRYLQQAYNLAQQMKQQGQGQQQQQAAQPQNPQ